MVQGQGNILKRKAGVTAELQASNVPKKACTPGRAPPKGADTGKAWAASPSRFKQKPSSSIQPSENKVIRDMLMLASCCIHHESIQSSVSFTIASESSILSGRCSFAWLRIENAGSAQVRAAQVKSSPAAPQRANPLPRRPLGAGPLLSLNSAYRLSLLRNKCDARSKHG